MTDVIMTFHTSQTAIYEITGDVQKEILTLFNSL